MPSIVSCLSSSKFDVLAAETLAQIFILGASTPAGHPDTLYDTTSFPALVSHVSRRWRSIALNTPRLWSRIFICGALTLSTDDQYDGSEYLRSTRLAETTCLPRVQAFLERSKSCPLTLHIDVRTPDWFRDPKEDDHPFTAYHMSAVLDYLIPHLDRWQDLEILCDAWAPLHAFLGRCSGSELRNIGCRANSLRRLALRRCNAYLALEDNQFYPSHLKSFFNPFEEAPLLQNVTLSGVHIDWNTHLLRNLTELSLEYHAQDVLPSAPELAKIIKSSPNLKSLCIHGWDVQTFDGRSASLDNTILLSDVERLSLGWVNASSFQNLLSLFAWRMPKLRHLSLEDVTNSLDPSDAQDSSCILEYISQQFSGDHEPTYPNHGPVELSLNCLFVSSHSLSGLIKRLPRLQKLALHDVHGADLESLGTLPREAGDNAVLCPDLTRVVLSGMEQERVSRWRHAIREATSFSSHATIFEIHDLLEYDSEIEDFDDDVLEACELHDHQSSVSSLLLAAYRATAEAGADDKVNFFGSASSHAVPASPGLDRGSHDGDEMYWPIVSYRAS